MSSNRTRRSGFHKRSKKRKRREVLRLEPLEQRYLLAVGPELLADIGLSSSDVREITQVGSAETNVFFVASTADTGEELWRSDGTSSGTFLVKDINPGAETSDPQHLTDVDGTLFFRARNGVHGEELWKSDGTSSGTVLVKDIRSGGGSDPRYLTDVGGTLFFSAFEFSSGRELWKSDGSSSGTVLVKDIRSGGGSYPHNLVNVDGVLFFSAFDDSSDGELWTSDGSSSGTVLVKDIRAGGSSNPNRLTDVNGTLFFSANDGSSGYELWMSDGSSSGTELVKDIRSLGSSSPRYLTDVGGILFFTAFDDSSGFELWRSDGSSSGTELVRDIRSPGSSNPRYLTNVGGTLFFSADDGANGVELWKSDGSSSGTELVRDINPSSSYYGSFPHELTDVGGTLFFAAHDGLNGVELWQSDGSSSGTELVKDIRVGPVGSHPQGLTDANGTLFFSAVNHLNLFTSDGTLAGTQAVANQFTFASDESSIGFTTKKKKAAKKFFGSETDLFVQVGDTTFFVADDGATGSELWKTDGTSSGTTLVKDINTGQNGYYGYYYGGDSGSYPHDLTEFGGSLFFIADDGSGSNEQLWKSDGTSSGTVLVHEIVTTKKKATKKGFSNDNQLTVVGSTLFFVADDLDHGRELWKSDGTSSGTELVKDINPSAYDGSYPYELTKVGTTLFFSAYDGTNGNELWKSDGTSSGTMLVKDIHPTVFTSSNPRYLTDVGGTLFFSATNGYGQELWKSDGSSSGTELVKDIVSEGGSSRPRHLVNVGGTVFFSADNGIHGEELWKSDGTSSGTTLVKDILFGESGSRPQSLTNVGGTLFFSADDGTHGEELWKSDGSSSGTTMVKDIHDDSGPYNGYYYGSYPRELTAAGGSLFFSADDGSNGEELWTSDGTSSGTVLVKDINTLSRYGYSYFGDGYNNGSYPTSLSSSGGKLFFAANDGVHGIEPWVLTLPTPPTVNVTAAPEFLVNEATSGFQVTYAETRNVAANAAGDLMITWAGSGPGDTQGIFARRYDATNTPLGPAFLVNVTTTGNQRYPSVALGDGGESVVAWSGSGAGDNDGGVFVRLYDPTGTATSGEIKVNETTPSFQHRPVVAKASDGSFIVTWSGKGNGDSSGGVFARHYDSSGAPMTGEILVNTTTAINQQEPDIAITSDGSFVVTWSGYGPGDSSGVFFQRFNSSAGKLGSETRVNTSISSQQKLPSVGIDGAGNFTIVWSGFGNQSGQNDNRGVFLQRYNATGVPIGGETRVNATTLYDQEDASISVAPSGASTVTWTSMQAGQMREIMAQEYDAGGAPVGVEIDINSTTSSDQKFSSVAVRGESAYTVVWSGRGVGDTTGVFAATRLRMPVPLVAQQVGAGDSNATAAGADLDAVLAEATQRWVATGLSAAEVTALAAVTIQAADWDGNSLGGNLGSDIYIDLDAAGHGWFIDATLADDEEFDVVTAASERTATKSNAAFGRMDLLSVVMHELGHALGKSHADATDVMGDTLPSGTRRLPSGPSMTLSAVQVDALLTQPLRDTSDPAEQDGQSQEWLSPLVPVTAPVIHPRQTQWEIPAEAVAVTQDGDNPEEDEDLEPHRWDLTL